MTYLQNFFLICSGVHPSILKRTPTELNRFVGIGATIFFTGIFAALAAGYALYTVFDNYITASIFGMLWGIMIFNLDRYIVSTIKKKGSFFRDITSAFPRLILAVLIAVVIAKPLELKIFESEINAEIELMQQESYMSQENLLNDRYRGERERLLQEVSELKSEIDNKTTERNNLDQLAIEEADGTGGTMQRNMGPIYKIKKAEADKAQIELDNVVVQNQPLIDQKQDQLLALDSKRSTELAEMNRVELTGLASRIEAMDRLGKKSNAIMLAGIFIMLLFVAVETSPIFVKLIAERSPYDYVLNKHEHSFRMNHEAFVR
ncbi:MAG: DUF4407 domain-containing protein, partial [Saprospiraceae bacterium]|nr:DUF4407 domain-containing protein [Saprospiraceae bacterium]